MEVGCGAGALMYDLLRLGFDCQAVEVSEHARRSAKEFGEEFGFEPRDDFRADWIASMDILVSMDALEHIEDDVAALSEWSKYLRSGGLFLLGVPCHMSKWGASDIWAGHFRRYEKDELIAKLGAQGFEVISFETYGFPLANVTSWTRNRMVRKQLEKEKDMSIQERTQRSGVDRSAGRGLFPIIRSWFGRLAMRLNYLVQRLFLKTNLGDGFLVLARKVS